MCLVKSTLKRVVQNPSVGAGVRPPSRSTPTARGLRHHRSPEAIRGSSDSGRLQEARLLAGWPPEFNIRKGLGAKPLVPPFFIKK